MNAAERKATQSIHNRYSVVFPYSMTKYSDSKNVITSIVIESLPQAVSGLPHCNLCRRRFNFNSTQQTWPRFRGWPWLTDHVTDAFTTRSNPAWASGNLRTRADISAPRAAFANAVVLFLARSDAWVHPRLYREYGHGTPDLTAVSSSFSCGCAAQIFTSMVLLSYVCVCGYGRA